MKAIRKEPGCAPELIDIDNTLKALKTEVGGYIETVTIASDAVVICDVPEADFLMYHLREETGHDNH